MTTINTNSQFDIINEKELQQRVQKNLKDARQLRSDYLAETAQRVPFQFDGLSRAIIRLIDRYSKTSSGPFTFWRSV